jgi:hypothetical protein
MLLIGLTIFAVASALWLTYMIRYPRQWSAWIDRRHAELEAYRLSFVWMQRAEKGITLKIVVAALTVLTLMCVATLLRHPTALSDFIHGFAHPHR